MSQSEVELNLLLKAQGKDADEILKLYRNVAKDGPQRWKAVGYVSKVRVKLEEPFARFEQRHPKIISLKISWNHPYLRDRCWDNIMRVSGELRDKFLKMEQEMVREEAEGEDPLISEKDFEEPPVEEQVETTLMELAEKEIAPVEGDQQLRAQWTGAHNGVNHYLEFVKRFPQADKASSRATALEMLAKLETVHDQFIVTMPSDDQSSYWDALFVIKMKVNEWTAEWGQQPGTSTIISRREEPVLSEMFNNSPQTPLNSASRPTTAGVGVVSNKPNNEEQVVHTVHPSPPTSSQCQLHTSSPGLRLPRLEIPKFGDNPGRLDAFL